MKFLKSIANLPQQEETLAACCSWPFPTPRPLASNLHKARAGLSRKFLAQQNNLRRSTTAH